MRVNSFRQIYKRRQHGEVGSRECLHRTYGVLSVCLSSLSEQCRKSIETRARVFMCRTRCEARVKDAEQNGHLFVASVAWFLPMVVSGGSSR